MHCKMPEMLPEDDTLHIVTAINNPLLWHSRYALARGAIVDWLKEPNVHVTIVEVAHGDRKHCLCDLYMDERVTHIKVYAKTMAWSKENCMRGRLFTISISIPSYSRGKQHKLWIRLP